MAKLAIVGLGKWGKILLSEFSKHSEIIYAVTKGDENKSWLKENFPQIIHTTDLESVLNSDIDGIIIATPPSLHYQQSKSSLAKGKHVFVEKPPAKSAKEAEELLKLAKRKNLTLFVDHVFLFDEAFIRFKKILQKEQGVKKVTFKWLKWGSFEDDIVWNLLYHDICLAKSLFGDPIYSKRVSGSQNGNKIHARLEFLNKKRAEIFINRKFKGEKTKIISAEAKNLSIVWEKGTLYIKSKRKEDIFLPKASPLTNICKEFSRQIGLENKNYENFLQANEIISILGKQFAKR